MANSIKAVRGTRDLLPPDTETWNFVEAAVRDIFRVYNFREIRTPIIEELQLFQRSVGEETDIVSKELFTLQEGIARERELKEAWKLRNSEYIDISIIYPALDFSIRKDRTIRLVAIKNKVTLLDAAKVKA